MNLKLITFLSISAIAACFFSYHFIDIPLLYWVASYQGPVKNFFGAITYLGESTAYLVVSCAAFLWYRYFNKKPVFSNMGLFVFASIAGSGILNALLKFVFGRCRPGLLLSGQLYGFKFFSTGYDYTSFPSGHANTVAALLLALYLISNRWGFVFILAAIPLALSRVVIGSHFLSDVIFGSYLAVMTTLFLKYTFEKNGLWITGK